MVVEGKGRTERNNKTNIIQPGLLGNLALGLGRKKKQRKKEERKKKEGNIQFSVRKKDYFICSKVPAIQVSGIV